MPITFEKNHIRLNESEDARIKISKSEHPVIKHRHTMGDTIKDIAREYKVHPRTIEFILSPEKLKTVNVKGKWRKYYDKKKHGATMQRYRENKEAKLKKRI